MSLKNPVTPPGFDPGTVRLVAQRLNHYATPGPIVPLEAIQNTCYSSRPSKIRAILQVPKISSKLEEAHTCDGKRR